MNYFKSIDTLPIIRFENIIKTGNLNFLLRDVNFDDVEVSDPTDELIEIWNNIKRQIPHLDLTDLQKECLITAMELQAAFEVENSKQYWKITNKLNILKADIKPKETNEPSDTDFSTLYMAIGKMYNSVINPFTYTTRQFFNDKHALYGQIERDNKEFESRKGNKFDV